MIRRRREAPYALLSVLLRYPDGRLAEGRGEVAEAIAALPPSPARRSLEAFAAATGSLSATELEQRYVETFDLRRSTSLYLGYYLHGDTRRRGVALLRLRRLYAAAGLEQTSGELPDYLPLLLEFAALAPDGLGEALLREHRPALELLRAGLHELGSPYAHLLDALVASMSRLSPVERARLRRLAADGPPEERVGLEPFAPPDVMPEARV